jgi:hypothetical protein
MTVVFRPFIWVGMNTILIYLLSPAAGIVASLQVDSLVETRYRRAHTKSHRLLTAKQSFVYYGDTQNNLLYVLFKYIFCKDPYCEAPLNITDVCGDGMNCGPRWLPVS